MKVLLHNTKLVKNFGSKLESIWLGPYRISKVHIDARTKRPIGSYELSELDGVVAFRSIRADRVRIFLPRTKEQARASEWVLDVVAGEETDAVA